MSWVNFFELATNVHFDSQLKWWDVGGSSYKQNEKEMAFHIQKVKGQFYCGIIIFCLMFWSLFSTTAQEQQQVCWGNSRKVIILFFILDGNFNWWWNSFVWSPQANKNVFCFVFFCFFLSCPSLEDELFHSLKKKADLPSGGTAADTSVSSYGSKKKKKKRERLIM